MLGYDRATDTLELLSIDGQPVRDDQHYDICLKKYFADNAIDWLGLPREELDQIQEEKVISTSDYDVVEEYLRHHQHLDARVEGRLIFK